MLISRTTFQSSNDLLNLKKYWINCNEYHMYFKNNEEYIPRKSNGHNKNYYDYVSGAANNNFAINLSKVGVIKVFYGQKVTIELIAKLGEIADAFDAKLLINPQQEYPRHKILAAQKRLAKKSKEPQTEYQKESFGGNNIWLAIRSNATSVKNFFNLDGEQKSWQEGLRSMHACSHMFLFEFRGWVFLAGQLVDSLFAEDGVKGEKAIEKRHVDKLLEWGKTFTDIQLFMHYDRSEYFNAFYRVLNGKLEYGEYETESYKKKYGKMPKNIKELPDNNANTVAIEWSYEPDYLRYQIELKNAKAWILNVK